MTKPRKKRPVDSGFDPAALDALLGERRTMGEVDELFRLMKKALRKIIKTRGHFPTDEAALKLLYPALRNMQTRWATARQWIAALPHFAVLFGDRFVPET